MKRTWVIVLAALCLLGLTGLVTLYLWLGSLIKAGIERIGPQVTKTPVSVEAVTISLLSGCATVNGLVIGNPPGYRAPRTISIGQARVCVAPLSIFSNPLVVTEITVTSPEVTVEGMFGGSNINKIRDHVQAFAASEKATPEATPAQAGSRRILVREFRLSNGHTRLWLNAGPLGERGATVGMPDIHLQNIGKETNGAKPAELASAISAALFNAIKRAVTG
ncbi:MAG: hypothetical protein EPO61_04950 [Nitrospirae bacterium]|nr:MAG: hypothetical protein EPO61_04950 [Nitrospirota bacterium]